MWKTFNSISDSFHTTDDTDLEKIDLNMKVKNECYNCGSNTLIFDDGMKRCNKCGYTNGVILDMQQEWRYYGADDSKKSGDPTRCGMPTSTLFASNAFGAVLKGYGNERYRRLLKWNSIQYKAKSRMAVFKLITDICSDNNIPYSVADKAKLMYKIVSDNVIKRGVSRESLIAACVFYACKDRNISRKRREIARYFGINIKRMTIGCNHFKEIMFTKNPEFVNSLQPSSIKDFISRNCVLLGLDDIFRDIAIYIANVADKLGIVMDNTPSSISVGSIYLVIQEFKLKISKKTIAEKCNTSQVTVSKTFKILKKYKKYLLPSFD